MSAWNKSSKCCFIEPRAGHVGAGARCRRWGATSTSNHLKSWRLVQSTIPNISHLCMYTCFVLVFLVMYLLNMCYILFIWYLVCEQYTYHIYILCVCACQKKNPKAWAAYSLRVDFHQVSKPSSWQDFMWAKQLTWWPSDTKTIWQINPHWTFWNMWCKFRLVHFPRLMDQVLFKSSGRHHQVMVGPVRVWNAGASSAGGREHLVLAASTGKAKKKNGKERDSTSSPVCFLGLLIDYKSSLILFETEAPSPRSYALRCADA